MFSFRTLKKITIQITSVHVNVTNKKEKNHESNEIKITNFQFVFFFFIAFSFFFFLVSKASNNLYSKCQNHFGNIAIQIDIHCFY